MQVSSVKALLFVSVLLLLLLHHKVYTHTFLLVTVKLEKARLCSNLSNFYFLIHSIEGLPHAFGPCEGTCEISVSSVEQTRSASQPDLAYNPTRDEFFVVYIREVQQFVMSEY